MRKNGAQTRLGKQNIYSQKNKQTWDINSNQLGILVNHGKPWMCTLAIYCYKPIYIYIYTQYIYIYIQYIYIQYIYTIYIYIYTIRFRLAVVGGPSLQSLRYCDLSGTALSSRGLASNSPAFAQPYTTESALLIVAASASPAIFGPRSTSW